MNLSREELQGGPKEHGAQAQCSGQAAQEPETARLSGERLPSFSGYQLVTEGARVDQVGVELPKRAVVWVVMC